MEGSGGGVSAEARVKEEPEVAPDYGIVEEEAQWPNLSSRVKEEAGCVYWDESDFGVEACGVSTTAALAGLYADHVVKDELVLGPERPHRPTASHEQPPSSSALLAERGVVSARGRSCSVRLERLLLDAERCIYTILDEETPQALIALTENKKGKVSHKTTKKSTASSTKTKHVCTICEKKFHSLSSLKLHVHTHSGEKPYTCLICKKGFSTPGNLKCHSRIHTGEKPFKCVICPKMFRTSNQLDSHERCHTGERPYACDMCECTFSQQTHLKNPMSRVHAHIKTQSCNICRKSFSCLSSLNLHKRTHTETAADSSATCSQQFLKVHTIEKPSTSNTFKHLKAHEAIHNGFNYYCVICAKQFKNESVLKTHERDHRGEKPYVCQVCQKGFSQAFSLNRHKLYHHNVRDKSYACEDCPRKFFSLTDLNIHKQGHAGLKYSCVICQRQFGKSSLLKIHLRSHTGEKPYKCGKCKKAFATASNLCVHKKIHTKAK